MNPNWAVENLQTIRTLMERSSLYRRALAPIMLFAGAVGLASGLAGWWWRCDSNFSFVLIWLGAAFVAMLGALLLVRRQALKDAEPFWSPPTRRVGQALLPAFAIGLMLAMWLAPAKDNLGNKTDWTWLQIIVIIGWTWLYGCSVHAAGFFMPRGVRWLGWIFIAVGGILLLALTLAIKTLIQVSPHLLMGGIFGGIHLVYGIYLSFTESKAPVA